MESGSLTTGVGTTTMQLVSSPITRWCCNMQSKHFKAHSSLGALVSPCLMSVPNILQAHSDAQPCLWHDDIKVSRGVDLLVLERRQEENLVTKAFMHKQSIHARQVCVDVMYCQTLVVLQSAPRRCFQR